MKISYNWLKKYIPIDISCEETSEILTSVGLEVESLSKIESIKGSLEGVVIGEVLTCEKHPGADKLSITTVNIGNEMPLHIVCGAPNVAAGQKVPVATIGTKIWTSDSEFFEIKQSKIRGEVSEGMICAEDELGLGTSHDGIMILDAEAKTGISAKDYFKIDEDIVIEIGITPNRSDATSHLGVARDLIAGYNAKYHTSHALIYPSLEGYAKEKEGTKIEVQVDDHQDCPRYSGVVISDITVQESPKWLQNYLNTVGLRPINNVVDITNFVLLEMGQPLHAFDAEKITGNLIQVKKLPKETLFTTLDLGERKLNGNELMICNAKEGMCIAGVMGGISSGVTEKTKTIFLESAYFNPVSIRKTSKYHGLKTDASFRYERGGDPDITPAAIKRAALLLNELAGGVVSSDIVDIYPIKIEPHVINLTYNQLKKLIGKEIPTVTVKNILQSLEIRIVKEDETGLTVQMPLNKVDVTRPCDLIEEILRIYGYNQIEISTSLYASISNRPIPDSEKIQNIISDYLSSNGFSEIMNNSLSKVAYYENNKDFPNENNALILNPLSKDLGVMRRSLLYGGLECVVHNLNRKVGSQKLYEFGNIYDYHPENKDHSTITKRYKEEKYLSLWLTGGQTPESWNVPGKPTDFYYLKSFIENIFKRLRIDYNRFSVVPSTSAFFSEGLDLIQKESKKKVAGFGRLSKKTIQPFDIKQEVYYGELSWDVLLKILPKQEVQFNEIPKYPEVRRDLSLLIDKTIKFYEIESVAFETEKKILKHVGLFDIYEGDKIEDNKKSYAVSFILQDSDKTLDDKRIDSIMQKLEKAFEIKFQAKVRK